MVNSEGDRGRLKEAASRTLTGLSVEFALHSLGWKAFQDLCATILSEVLGQQVQVFSQTRDRDRDAAFQGIWRPAFRNG